MNIEELKKQIDKLNVKSDEFWDLYKHIAYKYYTTEHPGEFEKCAKIILRWMDVCVGKMEEQVIVVVKVVEQVFQMRHKKTTTCTGIIGFSDESFFFDIYTTENEKDKMKEILGKVGESIKDGTMVFKDKMKPSPKHQGDKK